MSSICLGRCPTLNAHTWGQAIIHSVAPVSFLLSFSRAGPGWFRCSGVCYLQSCASGSLSVLLHFSSVSQSGTSRSQCTFNQWEDNQSLLILCDTTLMQCRKLMITQTLWLMISFFIQQWNGSEVELFNLLCTEHISYLGTHNRENIRPASLHYMDSQWVHIRASMWLASYLECQSKTQLGTHIFNH